VNKLIFYCLITIFEVEIFLEIPLLCQVAADSLLWTLFGKSERKKLGVLLNWLEQKNFRLSSQGLAERKE